MYKSKLEPQGCRKFSLKVQDCAEIAKHIGGIRLRKGKHHPSDLK